MVDKVAWDQGQSGGLRSGRDKVGVGSGCQAGAGSATVCGSRVGNRVDLLII